MEVVIRNPLILLMFLSFPLLIFLHNYFFEHAKRKALRFANYSAMKRVTGTHLITKNRSHLLIRLSALAFLIIGASEPEIWYNGKVSVTDYVIAIDTSASMLSKDVPPFRLDVAKKIASEFVDRFKEEVNIGLVSFSGVSFIRSQMTSDKGKIKNAINSIDIDLAGGTDIGAALVTSTNLLIPGEKSKAIVLISDGSDTAGILVDESLRNALDYAVQNQVLIHTISIGSGIGTAGYLEDTNLRPVYDSNTLKEAAESTGGRFYEVRSINEMYSAFSDLQNEVDTAKVKFSLENIMLMFGFLMLLIEWGLMNTLFRAIP